MVAKLKAIASAVDTAPITAKDRGILRPCRNLTSGARTKLSNTAKAMGTKISRVR